MIHYSSFFLLFATIFKFFQVVLPLFFFFNNERGNKCFPNSLPNWGKRRKYCRHCFFNCKFCLRRNSKIVSKSKNNPAFSSQNQSIASLFQDYGKSTDTFFFRVHHFFNHWFISPRFLFFTVYSSRRVTRRDEYTVTFWKNVWIGILFMRGSVLGRDSKRRKDYKRSFLIVDLVP